MRKNEDIISVDFKDDAARTIRRLSEELGLKETIVVEHLIRDGMREQANMYVVKDTLEHLKDVYNRNSDMSHEEFLRLMAEAKTVPITSVESSIKHNEIVRRAFALSDESSAYMQRVSVIDEIIGELRAKGVFA